MGRRGRLVASAQTYGPVANTDTPGRKWASSILACGLIVRRVIAAGPRRWITLLSDRVTAGPARSCRTQGRGIRADVQTPEPTDPVRAQRLHPLRIGISIESLRISGALRTPPPARRPCWQGVPSVCPGLGSSGQSRRGSWSAGEGSISDGRAPRSSPTGAPWCESRSG